MATLSPVQQKFILHWGEMGIRWGINRTVAQIHALLFISPKPVNVLVGSDFTTVARLAGLGVRRISVGGALARAAWSGFLVAAREIAEQGTFSSLAGAVPFAEINVTLAGRAG